MIWFLVEYFVGGAFQKDYCLDFNVEFENNKGICFYFPSVDFIFRNVF